MLAPLDPGPSAVVALAGTSHDRLILASLMVFAPTGGGDVASRCHA